MIREHDRVSLTVDVPEYSLKQGEQGTVVFVYKQGKGYEVEFFDPDGRTKAVATLMASQVRALQSPPAPTSNDSRPQSPTLKISSPPSYGINTGKKELRERKHACPEC